MRRAKHHGKAPYMSVLMATYNNGPFLREAIDDVLRQSFTDFELIIIDDGSTDDTQEILRSYRDARLVLLCNPSREGIAAARNRTIGVSRGLLIAIADADDRYHPQRLEKQVGYLREHPEVDISVSEFCKMTVAGQVFERVRLPRTDRQIKFNFLWQNPLSHPTALCRRDLVLKSGGYDESFSSAVDADWFGRMSEYATFGMIPEALHHYRKYPSSTSENHDPAQALKRFWISHQLVCRYLNRGVSENDGMALRDLLCAYNRMAITEVDVSLDLLHELLRKARRREDRQTWGWIRRRISRSLLAQAKNLSYVAPAQSYKLLAEAIRLHGSYLAKLTAWVQLARILTARIRGKVPQGRVVT